MSKSTTESELSTILSPTPWFGLGWGLYQGGRKESDGKGYRLICLEGKSITPPRETLFSSVPPTNSLVSDP